MFSVRFWGVRGSIACPGTSTLRFGGNTACMEIRAGERLIIVDMGTGMFGLGSHLIANGIKDNNIEADIFVSHTHLDHLMGFQMFAPFFMGKTKVRIYGPVLPNDNGLEQIMGEQMSYHLWPVGLRELAAEVVFQRIGEAYIDLGGGLSVKSKYLNHPVVCLGYRFNYEGKSIATAFDHETCWNIFEDETDAKDGSEAAALNGDDFFIEDAVRSGKRAVIEENKKMISFYKDADILIYDSMYTERDYDSGKQHWGHSTFKNAVEAGDEAGVQKLVLFHHDPSRTDDELERLEKECPNIFSINKDMKIIAAKEGMTIIA